VKETRTGVSFTPGMCCLPHRTSALKRMCTVRPCVTLPSLHRQLHRPLVVGHRPKCCSSCLCVCPLMFLNCMFPSQTMANLKPYTPKVSLVEPAGAAANEVEAGDLSAARSAAQMLKAQPMLQAQAKAQAQQVRARAGCNSSTRKQLHQCRYRHQQSTAQQVLQSSPLEGTICSFLCLHAPYQPDASF
jgi:hypothetical protein